MRRSSDRTDALLTALDAIPLPVSLAKGDGNAAFREFSGCEVWQDAIHPDDAASLAGALARARETRAPLQASARLRDRDGHWHTLRVDGAPSAPAGDDGACYFLTWRETNVDEEELGGRFSAFMNHIPALATLKDVDGRYLWVNRAFEDYVGIPLDAIRGVNVGDCFDELGQRAQEINRRIAESGKTYEEVVELPGRNGEHRTFLSTVFPVIRPSGAVAVGVVAKDVTQLRQQEMALADRARKQHAVAELGRRILRGAPDFLDLTCNEVTHTLGVELTAIVQFDRAGGEAVVVAAGGWPTPITGLRLPLAEYERAQWSLLHDAPAISNDLPAESRFRPWRGALEAGARSSISVPIPGDDGPFGMIVGHSLAPRQFPEGDVDFLLSLAHLLAAAIYRRRTDRELASQRAELQTLVDHAPDLISRYTPDGTILFVNDVARKGGWNLSDLVGKKVTELGMPPEIESAWVNAIRTVVESGKPFGFETQSKNGEFAIDVRVVPELEEDGKVVRLMAISRDVTARRRAEEEREMLRAQLEDARRAASVSRLGTTVAHEFNNVLMSISPFADVIARSARDDQRLQKASGYIRSAIARGRRVTQDIMRFTRPADPALQTIDLSEWLPRAVHGTLPLLGNTEVDLAPAPPLYARIDPQQLDQVIVNLLINARDAIAVCGGEGRIRVRLAGEDSSVVLRVEDDGCGVAAEHLDKLFEPFFTTKRSGAGLGLPVVQQILERHHGRIRVESRPVRGTSFIVTLPRVESDRNAPAPVEAEIAGRHVLLIEDEPAVADGIVDLLDASEAVVRVASSGAAALEMIEDELPEVVMLDVGLPDIDGVDLFAAIRIRWPELPVLFSTGHGDQARLDQVLRLPHVGHLVKPFGLPEVTAALAEALAR